MKKTTTILALTMAMILIFVLVACAPASTPEPTPTPTPTPEPTPTPSVGDSGKILVAYFSWSSSNNTKTMAEYIQEATGGDIFRIQPKTPYTTNYNDVIDVAQDEKSQNARPELLENLTQEQIDGYDVIFVGYPVWWYDAPMIIYSFLEANDFSAKTVITFATSGGSGISDSHLKSSIEANFISGMCIASFSAGDSSKTRVANWIEELGYTNGGTVEPEPTPEPDPAPTPTPEPIETYYTVTFNSNGGSAVESQSVLEGNSATEPAELTREGYTFDGWFSDEELTTQWSFDTNKVIGDIILYAKWSQNIEPDPEPAPTPTPDPDKTNILVVYFSATGTTEGVAKLIAEVTGGDIWEIVPQIPYTSDDLNYSNSSCRANVEQNDDTARPAISGTVDVSQYDVIFVGYPIWWGGMPKILFTFFDTYNLEEKTIVPFCTSGGSGISTSVNEIRSLEPNATVMNGQRFSGSASKATIQSWVNGLSLPTTIATVAIRLRKEEIG